jgi:hypothetical protein
MIRLRWDSFGIAVEGAAAPLAWLREFLLPAFEAGEAAEGARVALVLDPARYAALAAPACAREVACFTLDGGFRRLPCRDGAGGSRVLHDAEERVVQVVAGADVTVVAEEDHRKARTTLLRVVRELATAHALRRGMLPLHASAVEAGGRVVAFAGPRRSGKSTLLLHALLAGGARFVSNDRLHVDPRSGRARAMPTIVALREEALARFPALAGRLRERGYDRRWSLAETVRGEGRWPPSLAPAQLCAAAGADAAPGGPLAAVAFPAVSTEPGFDVRPLAPHEAAERLASSLIGADGPAEAYAGPGPVPPLPVADACAALAGRVRCLAVRLGEGAYEPPGVFEAIVAQAQAACWMR